MKKYIISKGLGGIALVMSLFIPVLYAITKYGDVAQTSAGKITIGVGVALLLGFRYIMYQLNEIADDGFGMSKKIARELKFIIPLFVLIAMLFVIETNVAGMVDVVRITLILNLFAAPFRIASYRLSKKYENDVGVAKLVARK